MSTPLSERSMRSMSPPPPPPTDAELQTQMQRMIDLQYDMQRVDREHHSNHGGAGAVVPMTMTTAPSAMPRPSDTEEKNENEWKASKNNSNNTGSSISSKEKGEKEVIEGGLHRHQDTADSFVGVGTVVFNEAKIKSSRRQASVDSDTTSTQGGGFPMALQYAGIGVRQTSDATAESSSDEPFPSLKLPPQIQSSLSKSDAHQSLLIPSSNHNLYGATETTTATTLSLDDPGDGAPPNLYGSYPYHDPPPLDVLFPPEATADASAPPTAADTVEEKPPATATTRRRRRARRLSCCLWDPIANCVSAVLCNESVHRSFCYGAIDGMLTGAGIVSTFCGMNLLSVQANNSPEIRALVVAFTAATCCADAVCMAIGHVWTTVLQQQQHAHERAEARLQLQVNKSNSKGLLVDLLLAKGMLKIDAMTLVDTLEGYPDLFVSAVTGDSLAHNLPPVAPQRIAGLDSTEALHLPPAADEEEERLLYGGTRPPPPPPPPPHGSWPRSHPSYSQLSEFDMDPDAWAIKTATTEARKESVSMLFGFSLFAVVPSLIYTLVPALLFGSHDHGGDSTPHTSVNPNTLVITLTACVMWCLGVWKSRFLDSNWLLFGVETVLVLLLCIAVAYGLGALLNKLFLPADYLLEVAKSTVTKAETVSTTPKQSLSSSGSGSGASTHSSTQQYSSHYDF